MHHNVHYEEQFDHHIEYDQVPFPVISPEGHIIRDHDGNVRRQDKNPPIPKSFGGAIVQEKELGFLV